MSVRSALAVKAEDTGWNSVSMYRLFKLRFHDESVLTSAMATPTQVKKLSKWTEHTSGAVPAVDRVGVLSSVGVGLVGGGCQGAGECSDVS